MAHDLRPVKPGDSVYLIDGSGYIFRAYHALPPLTRRSDGLPVGAVHGFCAMLNKLLRETNAGEAPTHLAVVFDKSERSFRTAMYPQYKAQRPPAPADLIPQFALIRQAVAAFRVACVEQDTYEADDLIATYARQAVEAGAKVRIVSSDKDLMQLVHDDVVLYDTMKDIKIGEQEVIEKFGVPPAKMIEVQALAGDSVDNIPGVPGIGVKTGAQLIQQYGDLETLLARAHEIKQPKRRENLIAFADAARLSRELVRLRDDVPLEHPIEELAVQPPDPQGPVGFLKAMEFTTLTRRIAAEVGVDPAEVEPLPVTVVGWPPEPDEAVPEGGDGLAEARAADAPATAAVEQAAQAWLKAPIDYKAYATVTDMAELERWIAVARDQGHVAVDTETTSLDPMSAELVGISLAVEPGVACYVPLAHRAAEGLDFGGNTLPQLPMRCGARSPQADAGGPRDPEDRPQHEVRSAAVRPPRHRRRPDRRHPPHLLCGRIRPHRPQHGRSVGEASRASPDLVQGGGGQRAIGRHLRSRAHRAGHALCGRRRRRHAAPVAFPQAPPAGRAQGDGLRDAGAPAGAGAGRHGAPRHHGRPRRAVAPVGRVRPRRRRARIGDLGAGRRPLQHRLDQAAGRGAVRPPRAAGGRKTATGAWSTDSDVLDVMAAQGVPIAGKILQWRQLTKLKSTYTDALPGHINAATGRVHTCYVLAATSTGRLASTEPNLQNIPVRTEEGRKIRRAFVARDGALLISADYSQIELRVLAHVADIPQLKRAFEDGLDIHAMTASEMFGVPIEGMDPNVRRRAKAINFGIIYGISAFGLANQLAIPREEAGEYIRTYFQRFPGIRDYMDATKRFAREHGYVETIFGRRCHFPASQPRTRPSGRSRSAPPSTRPSRARPPTSSAAPWCACPPPWPRPGSGRKCCCRSTTSWCSRPTKRKPPTSWRSPSRSWRPPPNPPSPCRSPSRSTPAPQGTGRRPTDCRARPGNP
jgi:DNA polymerase I